jgi:hypothetical protein
MKLLVREIDLKNEPEFLTENEYQIQINGVWLYQRVKKDVINTIPKEELSSFLLNGFIREVELVFKENI